MELQTIQGTIESILFVAGEAVTENELCNTLEIDRPTLLEALKGLTALYQADNRGLQLMHVRDTWQLATKEKNADYIVRFMKQETRKTLSNAAMETLAIIAYKQPISRIDINQIRGVSSSASSIKILLRKKLIQEAGRMDVPGRPILYKTTNQFLQMVQLKTLAELPDLEQFKD